MISTTLRRSAVLTLLACATALAAACGPESATDAGEIPADGVEALGTVDPTPPPTTAEPALQPEPGPAGPTDISPTYPDDPEGYAEEVIEAWAGDSPSWLEALTSEGAYHGIVDLNASPYDDWALLRCDGTAGSSYCAFTNPDGDVLTIRISHSLLGQAHAATEVTLEKTLYPNDGVLYVKEFVKAWQFGNTSRMLMLATPEVVDAVPGNAPTSVTYPTPTCCGGGLLQVKAQWGGVFARFDVGTTLLGGPHAILDYEAKLGLGS